MTLPVCWSVHRMYQAIGPALTTLGVAFLFSACVYYYCYGTGESNRLPGGSHQVSSRFTSLFLSLICRILLTPFCTPSNEVKGRWGEGRGSSGINVSVCACVLSARVSCLYMCVSVRMFKFCAQDIFSTAQFSWTNSVWWCIIISQSVMQKYGFDIFGVKIILRAYIIKIQFFLLICFLKCWSICNQISFGRWGSRSERRFTLSMNVRPDDIFRTARPFPSKFDMMYNHEP